MREDSHVFDWTFHCRDGSTKEFACKIICLRRVDGSTAGAVCANLDITDRKAAERRIEGQMRMIQEQRTQLQEMNTKLEHLAVTDGLTGLSNHRRFQELLEEAVGLHTRSSKPLSLLLLDIDHFKRFNDDFGHQVGDEVLQAVSAALKRTARDYEHPARYGGEEFAILLSDCNSQMAAIVAERFREVISSIPFAERQITASFGISTSVDGSLAGRVLINRADEALYTSKRNGRNRVTHFDEVEKNRGSTAA